MLAATTLPPTAFQDTALPLAVSLGFRAAIGAALTYVGNTAPNPPVGCTILDRDGSILAIGAHEKAGLPHAEALALHRLRESGRIADAHTLLVTLEPCNHQGRTAPCTDAILTSPVRAIWIGCPDPNPHVAGHGESRLRAAGLTVERLDTVPGLLSRQCAALIAPFRRWAETGRPWVTVKQALDPDGSMIPPIGSRTFTSAPSLILAHRLRRATDAIVTGVGTILADRPHLTVRHLPDHAGRRRILAVVGSSARLPADYVAEAIERGFDVRLVPSLDRLLPMLGEAGVLWAMVEAGPSLLASLRKTGLWDDQLTIRRVTDAPDDLSFTLASGQGSSPLILLPELAALDQEDACSRAS